MNRTGRLDVERKPRPPHPLGGLDLLAAAVARNLELRHRRALRRRERNFEIPARHVHVGLRRRIVDTVRQRRHLQQGLPRNGGVGVVEQMMRGGRERRIRRNRRRGNRLRGGKRAAKRRRRGVGVKGHVRAASVFRRSRDARRVAELLQRFLQQVQGRTRPKVRRRAPPQADCGQPRPGRTARGFPRPAAEPAAAGFPGRRDRVDGDGARLAAAACGARSLRRACRRCRADGVATVELLPSADCSVWRSTISAALRSGTPLAGLSPPPATPRGKFRISETPS